MASVVELGFGNKKYFYLFSINFDLQVSNCQDNCYEFDRLSEGKSYTIGIVVVDTMARKSGCATGTESTSKYQERE